MDQRTVLLAAIVTSLWLAAAPASAGDPFTTGSLRTPASRIVGLWNAVVEVGPCGGVPGNRVAATINYHSGGTLSETNTMPISGVPNMQGVPGLNQRGPGFGTWAYNPRTGKYRLTLRFNWFVDGYYNGYQQIERNDVVMSHDGKALTGPVRATRYRADGSKYAEFCGTETATRL